MRNECSPWTRKLVLIPLCHGPKYKLSQGSVPWQQGESFVLVQKNLVLAFWPFT